VPKCQIRALSLKEGKAAVDEKICLGCGACVKFCGSKALALAPRPRPPRTPGSEAGKFLRIAWEKGKLPALLFKLLKARLYL
jgi:ferredoxin